MNFLKTYWWVFALIIIAFLLYWFVFRTPASKTPSTTGCATTLEAWTAKLNEIKAHIEATPDWKTSIQTKVTNGTFSTYEQGKQAEAEWYMVNTLKMCKPATA